MVENNMNHIYTIRQCTEGYTTHEIPGPEWDPRPRIINVRVILAEGEEVKLIEWVAGANGHAKQYAKVELVEGETCVVPAGLLIASE
jgi:hypothetical protein